MEVRQLDDPGLERTQRAAVARRPPSAAGSAGRRRRRGGSSGRGWSLGLTRMVGDIDAAEDLAQDASLAALPACGPRDGVPPNPGAWLTLTAKHLRDRSAPPRRHLPPQALGPGRRSPMIQDAEQPLPASLTPTITIEDDLLRIVVIFIILRPPAQSLTLRSVEDLLTTVE